MANKYFEKFVEWMGEGDKYAEVPDDVKNEYKDVFRTAEDDTNIIDLIWSEHGFSSYNDGLFWLVNPNIYTPLAKKFPNISDTSIVFARSNLGGLFLYDKMPMGDSILYLNVHTGEREIVSTRFKIFFGVNVAADSFWKRECYGKFEWKVKKKYSDLKYDECLTFVPALALGGKESIKNLNIVKILENLEILAQLHTSQLEK